MAHIVEFSISELAGRQDDIEIKLNRDVNVFFGPNGSGKTSLLKILHSAMSNDADLLKNVPFKSAAVKIYSVDYHKVFTRSITQTIPSREEPEEIDINAVISGIATIQEVTSSPTSGSKRNNWITKPTPPRESRGTWRHRYLPTSRLYLGATRGLSSKMHINWQVGLVSEEQLDLYFARSLRDLWTSYYSDILREVRQAQEDGLASILKAVLSPKRSRKLSEELESEIAFKRVATFLRRQGSQDVLGSYAKFQKLYLDNPQFRSVISDINEVEKRIESAMAPIDKLRALISDLFSSSKSITFGDRSIDIETHDRTSIGLQALSSGEKQVLRIFIEALLARESSIIIDEPEISMHVDWQRQLVSAIKQLAPATQLIFATHSPEIIADIDNDKIFRL